MATQLWRYSRNPANATPYNALHGTLLHALSDHPWRRSCMQVNYATHPLRGHESYPLSIQALSQLFSEQWSLSTSNDLILDVCLTGDAYIPRFLHNRSNLPSDSYSLIVLPFPSFGSLLSLMSANSKWLMHYTDSTTLHAPWKSRHSEST